MQALNADDVRRHLETVSDWEADTDIETIARTWEFDNFSQAVEFIHHVAALAEEENHHPDIHLHNYKHVTLTLSTHSVGGLTEKDFALAAKIDQLD